MPVILKSTGNTQCTDLIQLYRNKSVCSCDYGSTLSGEFTALTPEGEASEHLWGFDQKQSECLQENCALKHEKVHMERD